MELESFLQLKKYPILITFDTHSVSQLQLLIVLNVNVNNEIHLPSFPQRFTVLIVNIMAGVVI